MKRMSGMTREARPRRSRPMMSLSDGGKFTVPSGFWWVSTRAMTVRGMAHAVPFTVCVKLELLASRRS